MCVANQINKKMEKQLFVMVFQSHKRQTLNMLQFPPNNNSTHTKFNVFLHYKQQNRVGWIKGIFFLCVCVWGAGSPVSIKKRRKIWAAAPLCVSNIWAGESNPIHHTCMILSICFWGGGSVSNKSSDLCFAPTNLSLHCFDKCVACWRHGCRWKLAFPFVNKCSTTATYCLIWGNEHVLSIL